jgi:CRP/FNR family cyclic AMP-dependent transcriptional regulator
MKKILLIEDDEHLRDNIKELLELSNYQVLIAGNGKEGIEKATIFHPNLIICDIVLPILDGFSVLHLLQRHELLRIIPFLFVSAKTSREDYRKAMELGADDFITKPFELTELLNAIEVRLKKQEYQSQLIELNGNNIHESADENIIIREFFHDRNLYTYKKKEIIYSEGNHLNGLYYLVNGRVKTYLTNEAGKSIITDLYNDGDIFGYVPYFKGSNYYDNAVAIEKTELAIIPSSEFETLLNNNHSFSKNIIQMLARNIHFKEHKLLSIAYNSLRRKVADALIQIHQKYHSNGSPICGINISRYNLASIAGTATESLVRTLSDFQSEKLIEFDKDGGIIILNALKLERLPN